MSSRATDAYNKNIWSNGIASTTRLGNTSTHSPSSSPFAHPALAPSHNMIPTEIGHPTVPVETTAFATSSGAAYPTAMSSRDSSTSSKPSSPDFSDYGRDDMNRQFDHSRDSSSSSSSIPASSTSQFARISHQRAETDHSHPPVPGATSPRPRARRVNKSGTSNLACGFPPCEAMFSRQHDRLRFVNLLVLVPMHRLLRALNLPDMKSGNTVVNVNGRVRIASGSFRML